MSQGAAAAATPKPPPPAAAAADAAAEGKLHKSHDDLVEALMRAVLQDCWEALHLAWPPLGCLHVRLRYVDIYVGTACTSWLMFEHM